MILIAMLEHFYVIFMADIACFLMKWIKLFKAYEKSLRMALSHRHWVFPDYVLDKETLIYQGNSNWPSLFNSKNIATSLLRTSRSLSVQETLIHTFNSSSWPVHSYFTWPQWYCCLYDDNFFKNTDNEIIILVTFKGLCPMEVLSKKSVTKSISCQQYKPTQISVTNIDVTISLLSRTKLTQWQRFITQGSILSVKISVILRVHHWVFKWYLFFLPFFLVWFSSFFVF